jgi:hypothetical protein
MIRRTDRHDVLALRCGLRRIDAGGVKYMRYRYSAASRAIQAPDAALIVTTPL